MACLLVDGDYWLSGLTPASEADVRAALDELCEAVEEQLRGRRGASPSCAAALEQRVAFFSSALLHSLPAAQRAALVSVLRRARFQTRVCESVRGRVGSPVDAAMCTHIVLCALAARPSHESLAPAAAPLTLCIATANAYVATALDVATASSPAAAAAVALSAAPRRCNVVFAAFDGDDVAEELLCYAASRRDGGDGVARLRRRGGVAFVPHADVAAEALAALLRDDAQLPLLARNELLRLQRRLSSRAPAATTAASDIDSVALPRGSGDGDAALLGAGGGRGDAAGVPGGASELPAARGDVAATSGDVRRDIRVLSVVGAGGRDDNEGGDEALPPGWAAVVDAQSGRTFYHHRATDQTTWTRPPPPQQHAPAAGWAQALDAASGKTYYYNTTTGQTSWTPPPS